MKTSRSAKDFLVDALCALLLLLALGLFAYRVQSLRMRAPVTTVYPPHLTAKYRAEVLVNEAWGDSRLQRRAAPGASWKNNAGGGEIVAWNDRTVTVTGDGHALGRQSELLRSGDRFAMRTDSWIITGTLISISPAGDD